MGKQHRLRILPLFLGQAEIDLEHSLSGKPKHTEPPPEGTNRRQPGQHGRPQFEHRTLIEGVQRRRAIPRERGEFKGEVGRRLGPGETGQSFERHVHTIK